ncbi:MAG: lytic transglycosylase domain-containing protein, partial [Kineosporiaceae bacterium]
AWITLTHTACPDLPTPWIAAVMAQESGFRPDAWAEDANGGTHGLFQLNAAVWRQAYGASWDADLDHNGVADIEDPQIHASTAGRYLCQRLDGVRRLRAAHPDWPLFQQRSDLDGLVIAHNAGEAWQPRYPVLPGVTQTFLTNVAQRVADWSEQEGATPPRGSVAGSTPGCPPPDAAVTTGAPPSNTGAVAGDPAEVAAAVHRAQILARDRSGWLHWCDRLVCRAYGYTNSGYVSAIAHWTAMRTNGLAHPRDHCPPTGAFAFWTTSGPHGHAALVTHADPGCDPDKTLVLTNMILDKQHGVSGGAYIVTLTHIEAGFVTRPHYLGWSKALCIGGQS